MEQQLLQEPMAIFLAVVAVVFIAPLLAERVRIPGVVGLVLGGMLIGTRGLGLLSLDSTLTVFGSVGHIYLMFNAGLQVART